MLRAYYHHRKNFNLKFHIRLVFTSGTAHLFMCKSAQYESFCHTFNSGLRIYDCEELSVLGEHDDTLWVLWPVCLWSRSQMSKEYFLIPKSPQIPAIYSTFCTLRNGETVVISLEDSIHLNIFEALRGLIRCIERCTTFPLKISSSLF
jgi:hypothetical protein